MTEAPEAKLDINLRVADLEASVRWYEEMFGAPPIYRGEDRSVDGRATAMACFRIGGVKLWLLPGSTGSGEQRVGIALMVRTALGPLRASLAARGAQFDDHPMPGFPIDADGVRQGRDAEFFYLLDPDGHRIEYCRVFRKGEA
ncbi:VOC family protein [Sphingomonas lacunae]|uniref:VOC family protein n=1 Tax=Sphingomonas lacunae TaxID=2698828 RepID=A0A6M4AQV4_9SPHN|nr:VOC family protein [Sphingomonas lacunae]QJQ31418.1 VOC family protein [Sphingomonas lacunae]